MVSEQNICGRENFIQTRRLKVNLKLIHQPGRKEFQRVHGDGGPQRTAQTKGESGLAQTKFSSHELQNPGQHFKS